MISPSERNLSLDVIRVVAMCMVIVLHTFRNFVERPDFFGTPIYWILLPIVVISMAAVLIFFTLSGYLVLPKQRSIRGNFEKTVDRLVFPLFFFESLNALYWFEWIWRAGYPLSAWYSRELPRLTGFPSSPLWFLYVLIALYLLNPLLQPIFSDNKKRLAQYLTILAFSLPFAVAILEYPAGRYDAIYTNFTGWLSCIFYYLYGGLLAKGWGVSLKTWQWVGVLLVAWFSHMSVDYIWNLSGQTIVGVYYWLMQLVWFLGPLLVTVSLLHVILKIDWSALIPGRRMYQTWTSVITFLASISFGVYLIHPLVNDPLLRYVVGWHFDVSGLHPIVFNILNFTLVFGISAVITLLVSKTPYLRKVIGEPAKIEKR